MKPSANKQPPIAEVARPPVPRASQARAPQARVPQPARPPAAPVSGQAAATPQPTPAPRAKAPVSSQPAPESKYHTITVLSFVTTALLIIAGFFLPTERYISPRNGIGYVLGIIGGSLMLVLLLYPARKRLPWLGFMGSVKAWFTAHVVLGIVGPLFVLYHSNFSLGATNSNAALFAMLLVSGSGIIGRYCYIRIHDGLTDRRSSRNELQAAARELRTKVAGSSLVPNLLTQLDEAEERLLACGQGTGSVLTKPLHVSAKMFIERWRLTRSATKELRAAASQSRVLAQQHRHFAKTLRRYVAKRLQATRDVAEFESYERLFSLWHLLHVPLFFILLVAGIVHVFAVHIY